MVDTVNSVRCVAFIDGHQCTFQNKHIRSIIESMAEVNETFNLPEKYTYIITANKCAKIIKK
jgi:hypothetical protein